MGTRIASFSNFVIELNQRTPQDNAEGLAKWAVAELSETLGFDAAWYGWATLRPQGPEIYANATYNLPEDFYLHWLSMSDQDLLVRAMIENPGNVAIYDRAQRRQTDGMADLSDRYGLTRMTTAMNGRVSDFASFYLSSYRTGKSASSWSEEDREFLQCASSGRRHADIRSAEGAERDTRLGFRSRFRKRDWRSLSRSDAGAVRGHLATLEWLSSPRPVATSAGKARKPCASGA